MLYIYPVQPLKNIFAKLWPGNKPAITGRPLWWIDNKMGGYDGYELQPGGKLVLLNWDLFRGIKWEITPAGLYTEMVYKRNGNVLKKTAEILSLTSERMELKTVTEDNEFVDTYIKISYGGIADGYYGHYTHGESYVQVIPVSETQFQLVFSKQADAEVVKYYGYVDEAQGALCFNIGEKAVVLQHSIVGGSEELKVGDERYYRPVWR